MICARSKIISDGELVIKAKFAYTGSSLPGTRTCTRPPPGGFFLDSDIVNFSVECSLALWW
jgi:hypothetical protein